jgi:hypothetical protein
MPWPKGKRLSKKHRQLISVGQKEQWAASRENAALANSITAAAQNGAPDEEIIDIVRDAIDARRQPLVDFQQALISAVLEGLFEHQDTWPKSEVIKELRAAGCSPYPAYLAAAKRELGIVSVRSNGGWIWTQEPGNAV